jgi:hypothetical protein
MRWWSSWGRDKTIDVTRINEKNCITFSKYEEKLTRVINLQIFHKNLDEARAACLGNKIPIAKLVESLFRRSAIPFQRLSYWNDPSCNFGRIKASRQGVFGRNGCRGKAIIIDPNFSKYLRYFSTGKRAS